MTEYINKENLIKAIEDKRPLNWNDTEAELAEQRAFDYIMELIKGFCDDETDRINELMEADKEGRCLVLPCKVGDTVYEWHYSMITKTIEREEYTVYGIEINERGITYQSEMWKTKGRWSFPERFEYWFNINDIGRSVFLTKEEREEVLEGLE